MKIERLIRSAGALAAWLALLLPVVGSSAHAQEKVDPAVKVLMAARGLYNRHRYADAAGEYETFLKEHAQHDQAISARYGLGLCHYRMRDYEAAEAQMAEVVKDAAFADHDDALAVLGHAQLMQRKYGEALASFDRLLAEHPDSNHAAFAAASRPRVLYRLGKTAEALKACDIFTKKHEHSPHRVGVSYFRALCLERQGKHAEGEKIAARLVGDAANSPYEHSVLLLLARCMEGQGKQKEAIERYRAFLKTAPPDRQAEGRYSLGAALREHGQHEEAIKELSAVAAKKEAGPYAAAARLELGLAQLDAGKPAEARKTLTAVAKEDKERANAAKYWLARCDMAEEKYAPARAALEALSKLKPPPANLDAVEFDRTACAVAMGEHEKAAGEFAAFVESFPKSELVPDAIYQRAFCLHKTGRYAESLELLPKASAAGGEHLAEALVELKAESLVLMGRYDEAGEAFRALRKLVGKDDEARIAFRLGQCAYLTDDYAKAIELLRPVAGAPETADDEQLVEAIFLLGDAQLLTGKHSEAAPTLERYVGACDGRPGEARYKLALAQIGCDRSADAVKNLQAVVDADVAPEWKSAAGFELGRLMYEQGRPDDARPALAGVVAGKPSADLAARATYLLGFLDLEAEKYDDAAKRFDDVTKKYPEHPLAVEALCQQGAARFSAQDYRQALALLEAYLKKAPEGGNAAMASKMRATCLARLDRADEAARAFAALAEDEETVSESILYQMAGAQRDEQANAEAVKTYRRLLERYPDGDLAPNARAELAELLIDEGEHAKAAELLETVVKDEKADPRALAAARYNLGFCRDKLGDHLKAAVAFDAYVAEHAGEKHAPSAMWKAGEAFARLKKYADAERHFAALLSKHPDDERAPVARVRLGQVQAQQNKFVESAATYDAFLKQHAGHELAPQAMYGMGWALQNQKKPDEARRWYARVIAATNDVTAAKAQFQTGQTWFAEGKLDRAVRELLKVDIVYAYPTWSALALLEAGKACEQLKDVDEAKASYAECVRKYEKEPAAKEAAQRLKALK